VKRERVKKSLIKTGKTESGAGDSWPSKLGMGGETFASEGVRVRSSSKTQAAQYTKGSVKAKKGKSVDESHAKGGKQRAFSHRGGKIVKNGMGGGNTFTRPEERGGCPASVKVNPGTRCEGKKKQANIRQGDRCLHVPR